MKKLTYFANKADEFKIVGAKHMKSDIDLLPVGKYKVTIEKWRKKASYEQFSYLYGIVYPMFLQAANNMGYEFTSVEELDLWCKAQWANKVIINRESGEEISIPSKKGAFNTLDELTYCNTLRDYCSEYFGVFIPDPDPFWRENKNNSEGDSEN